MPDRFFFPESLAVGPITITGAEAHHLAQVLRLKPGMEIVLFNGDGRQYLARLDAVHKNHVDATIVTDTLVSREQPREIALACPLPKGDRAAFLIEKLTELGVTRYLPLKTRRSVVHPGEGKMDKLHRYVIEASKQCGRNVLMTIEPLRDWADLAADTTVSPARFIADTSEGTPLASGLLSPHPGCIIALGPEGGWASDELLLADQHHWHRISLGPAILRIETAALAAAVLAAGP